MLQSSPPQTLLAGSATGLSSYGKQWKSSAGKWSHRHNSILENWHVFVKQYLANKANKQNNSYEIRLVFRIKGLWFMVCFLWITNLKFLSSFRDMQGIDKSYTKFNIKIWTFMLLLRIFYKYYSEIWKHVIGCIPSYTPQLYFYKPTRFVTF